MCRVYGLTFRMRKWTNTLSHYTVTTSKFTALVPKFKSLIDKSYCLCYCGPSGPPKPIHLQLRVTKATNNKMNTTKHDHPGPLCLPGNMPAKHDDCNVNLRRDRLSMIFPGNIFIAPRPPPLCGYNYFGAAVQYLCKQLECLQPRGGQYGMMQITTELCMCCV